MRPKPPFPPYMEAVEYLDDLVRRRNARLFIYEEDGGWWRAHVGWDTDHPTAPKLGYTGWGRDQSEATWKLAQAVIDDRENERP